MASSDNRPRQIRFGQSVAASRQAVLEHRFTTIGGAVGILTILIAVLVGAGLSQGASPVTVSGATTVQRRDLVATDTEAGTLSYANPSTVFNRQSGTITWLPQLGALIKPGQALYQVDGAPVTLMTGTFPAYRDLTSSDSDGPDIQQLNQNLVQLGFDPGHEITVNNTWQSGTTDAVERWQASLGQTQTGTVSLGQVVFLPGPQRVTDVEAALGGTGSSGATASGSSGSAGSASSGSGSSGSGSSSSGSSGSGSSSSGSSGSTASLETAPPRPQFVSLENAPAKPATAGDAPASASNCPSGSSSGMYTPPTTTNTVTAPPTTQCSNMSSQELQALLELLKAEELELQREGRSSSSSSSAGGGASGRSGAGASSATSAGGRGGATSAGGLSAGGGGGAAGGASASGASGTAAASPILQTTSTQVVVTVDLDATKQSEAVINEPVTVQMPNGNTVNGKITQVSPVAQSTSSSSSSGGAGGAASGTPSATVPVTIAVSGRLPTTGLDQAAVSVNFEQQVERNVLSVPVTALLATAGGGYDVQEATPPHRLIAVTPGLFAAGYVQISGSQIYPGLQVTDSQG